MNPEGYKSNEDNDVRRPRVRGLPGPRAAARPAAVRVHERRRHPARGVPRAALGARRGDGEPGQPRGRLRHLRPVGVPRLRQRRHRRRCPTPTCRSTRGSSWPRSATPSPTTSCATRSRPRQVREGPPAGDRHGAVQRRPAERRGLRPRAVTRDAAARAKPADRLVRDARRADGARPAGAGRRPAAARRGACRARPRPGHGQLDAGRRCRRLPRVPRGPRRRDGPDRSRRRGRPGRPARAVRGHDRRPRAATAYAVASLATIDAPVGETSSPAAPVPLATEASSDESAIRVDAAADVGPVARPWRPCIGSEHLALLLDGPGPGNLPVGDDLARGVPDRPGRARRGDGSCPRHPP